MTRDEVQAMIDGQKEACKMVYVMRPGIIAIIITSVTLCGFAGGLFAYSIGNESRMSTVETQVKQNTKKIEKYEQKQEKIVELLVEIKEKL